MTDLNLQQYKYRRNFPYNDTIKEDSDENLSENKSTITYNGKKSKSLLNKVLMGQIQKMGYQPGKQGNAHGHEVYNQEKMISQEIAVDSDKYFNMKSEHLIRNFNEEPNNDEIIYVEDLANDFGKQASERYIKYGDSMPKTSFQVNIIF